VADVAAIDRIDPELSYTAQELINLIRARTFPPYKGAYIEHDGSKIFLRLEMSSEESTGGHKPEAESEDGC
jgi:methionyl-tRNA formyltransferase